jgi:hypothetical protein
MPRLLDALFAIRRTSFYHCPMALFGRPTRRDEERAAHYRDWIQQRNPFAIASLVLGVFSLIEFGVLLIFGIAGIVCGVVALVQISRARRGQEYEQRGSLTRGDLKEGGAPADLPEYAGEVGAGGKLRGRRMAWLGIGLSAMSLVLAWLVYTWPWGAAGGGGGAGGGGA